MTLYCTSRFVFITGIAQCYDVAIIVACPCNAVATYARMCISVLICAVYYILLLAC